MHSRERDIIHFKGNLVFDEEPDWEMMAKGVEFYQRTSRHDHRPVAFDRAALGDDGAYRLPFKSYGHMSLFRRDGRERIELSREEAEASFLEDLIEEMERFFCCDVEASVLTPDFAHLEDLEDAADIYCPGRDRFDRGPTEAADLMPLKANAEGSDPLAELDALVGLDSVKQQVRDIVSLVRNHGRDKLPCLHMVFRGNPGTGKTTVARIIARIFDQEGVTDGKGTFVETDRGGLCGMFVGHTAARTKRVIDRAQGGVLFVDEAYALGMHDCDRDYGPEAIATLVKAMEDKRDDFVCILAGYSEPMEHMVDVNPGLRDRIGFYIDFPDYDADELIDVLRSFLRKDGFRLSSKADVRLREVMTCLVANKDESFSNARIVRKIYERVRMAHMISSTSQVIGFASVEKALANADLASSVRRRAADSTGFC